MTLVPVSEIPTVSLLYHLKKLTPTKANKDDVAPKASQSFNDRIGLIRGDITKLEVGAIVNAANNSLLGGGGVDGAIHRAAGRGLIKECRKLDGCDTGDAKITDAYELPCKKVVHAVGPVYDEQAADECEVDLASCYTKSLQLAAENDCKSIAFSALSTGVYGYPSRAAAPVAIKAVKEFLEGQDGDKLELVAFTTFTQKDVDAYNYWLPIFFPSTEVETEGDWEKVEGGESAENGPTGGISKAEKPETEKIEEVTKKVEVNLPEVTTTEPKKAEVENVDEPVVKKQKLDSSQEDKL